MDTLLEQRDPISLLPLPLAVVLVIPVRKMQSRNSSWTGVVDDFSLLSPLILSLRIPEEAFFLLICIGYTRFVCANLYYIKSCS